MKHTMNIDFDNVYLIIFQTSPLKRLSRSFGNESTALSRRIYILLASDYKLRVRAKTNQLIWDLALLGVDVLICKPFK